VSAKAPGAASVGSVAPMRRHGFDNYPREWWRLTLRGAKNVDSYDVGVE
jgi:D-alanyl-D-alanine dipeptidase